MTGRRNQARHAAAQTAPDAGRRPGWFRGRDDLAEAPPTDYANYAGYERPAPPAADVRYERPAEPPEADRPPEPPARQETLETWLKAGQLQFDYLIGHGLQPGDRLLEIGCGTLAAGHLFIDYLSTGNYYGIEFAPDALIGAQQAITEFRLQAKLPHVTLAGDLTLGFLPPSKFTVLQAPTVFLNAPIAVIGECLAHVTRVMTTDAIFDFAFDRGGGAAHQAFAENFYHRADTLIDLADYYGLDAELLKDWDQLGLPQSKIRITRRR